MLWRYIAIAVQFGIVVLITQHVDVVTAGRYFAIFGLVTVAAVAVGLGKANGGGRRGRGVRYCGTKRRFIRRAQRISNRM